MSSVSLFCVLLLGILEGITEWLPVSSTGHLILLDDRLPPIMDPAFGEFFRVAIQLGAILAVLLLSHKELNPLSRDTRASALRLWKHILLGVLPAAAVGVLLDDWISAHLFNPRTVALSLILWGAVFLLSERLPRMQNPSVTSVDGITPRIAVSVGLWQVLSLIPGTSRSGATMLGARLMGCTGEVAARYSFLLAIPTMLGASLLKGAKYLSAEGLPSAEELVLLAVGTLAAFLVSILSLRFLTDFARRHGLFAFGVYRILLGILVLCDYFL